MFSYAIYYIPQLYSEDNITLDNNIFDSEIYASKTSN